MGDSEKLQDNRHYTGIVFFLLIVLFLILLVDYHCDCSKKTAQSIMTKPFKPILWTLVDADDNHNPVWRVRVISHMGEAPCPMIKAKGEISRMALRSPLSQKQFDLTLCEYEVSPDYKVRILGRRLAARTENPEKIVILGDTGCRLTYYKQQSCNKDSEWPFEKIARQAAAHNPDLVIHLGDYHYREKPCPDGTSECRDSPFGDRWPTWYEDFFYPARPLLKKAPWIFIRGNHEDCNRAGNGWHHFFGTAPISETNKKCPDYVPTRLINFKNDLSFLALDTSYQGEIYGGDKNEDRNAWIENINNNIPNFLKDNTLSAKFILLHQPLWWLKTKKYKKPFPTDPKKRFGPDDNLELISKGISGDIPVVTLSGHTHNFQHITPLNKGGVAPKDIPDYKSQFIIGNGGTSRDEEDDYDVKKILASENYIDFSYGFAVLSWVSEEGQWKMEAYDIATQGKPKATFMCDFKTNKKEICTQQ